MSNVDHPVHYGGQDNPYEAIKVIEAWDLGFHLGNTVKYISRAGKKDPSAELEDLEKAAWYLNRRIGQLRDQATEYVSPSDAPPGAEYTFDPVASCWAWVSPLTDGGC